MTANGVYGILYRDSDLQLVSDFTLRQKFVSWSSLAGFYTTPRSHNDDDMIYIYIYYIYKSFFHKEWILYISYKRTSRLIII